MSKLFFPAVFHPESEGFSLYVPDLEGCNTQGDTMDEAYDMAIDAIGLCVTDLIDRGQKIPKPSNIKSIDHGPDDQVVLVAFDLEAYLKKHSTKSVKKTLTIPGWLNDAAEERNINFSGVLQQALIERLNLSE